MATTSFPSKGPEEGAEVVEIKEEFEFSWKDEILGPKGLKQLLDATVWENQEASGHSRAIEREDASHKRNEDTKKQDHIRQMEIRLHNHNTRINYVLIAIVSVLFGFSVFVLGRVVSNKTEDPAIRREAVSVLGPLVGLALGFLSGKIKWPSLGG